jgi:hypothetical protein
MRPPDLVGNLMPVSPSFIGQVYTIDTTPPTVVSVNRSGPNPTATSTVWFIAVFSESVTGVDQGDFALARSGSATGTITSVTGSGTIYYVGISGVSGNGTLGLSAVDNDTIVDMVNNPLGGVGTGNGNFVGQVYNIDTVPPTDTVLPVAPDPRTSPVSSIAVVFSEPVTGFDLADLTLVRSGNSVPLTGATLTTSDNVTWTLGKLDGLTSVAGPPSRPRQRSPAGRGRA